MDLKGRLREALDNAPSARRKATLAAILKAVDEKPDADLATILWAAISEHEKRAETFAAAGQEEFAKAEHHEAEALRGFLRAEAPPPKPAKPTKPVSQPRPTPKFSRTQIVIAAVALIAILGAGYYFLSGSSDDLSGDGTGSPQTVTANAQDHTLGDPKAPIVLLEYAAPSCPICAHLNAVEMPLIKKNYIDTGKIFYIFRVFVLRPADGAAEAIAHCLPADRYFPFIDMLFRRQKEWDPEFGIQDIHGPLVRMAASEGLSEEKTDQCIADQAEQDHINAVAEDAVTRFDIDGTPTLVINGQALDAGDPGWPALQQRFDALLANR